MLKNVKDALSLADALCRGGLSCAEVTFRTDAVNSLKRFKEKYKNRIGECYVIHPKNFSM